jgi:hypothetical protein
MTAEASNTRLTMSRRGPPAYRKPNQTRAARRRKDLIADFVRALGGPEHVTAILMRDIARAADLMALCEQERTKALRGEDVSIANLSRLEGAADRAVRRLRLPEHQRGGRTSSPSSIEDLVA